ncbi:cell division GTPase [Cenarchaeum symbiosum A]|uniref:Cell division GTPase n=1 Tax=Cenarchaeum symbiosum (strain A) TaxID=414004 RepID=A0RW55_CENSY|nr:cell division GTPase [Cenarchaeum symbiosum A]
MSEMRGPVLLVGAGGAGSRLASRAGGILGLDTLQISSDPDDLGPGGVLVPTRGVINPSSRYIRGCTDSVSGGITERISGCGTAVIFANLAGRSGSAIAPLVSRICRQLGRPAVSFAMMPFGFEKDRIANSGTALKRLREDSGCTIVIDNDAFLGANPGMSPAECHGMTDSAVLYMAGSLGSLPEGTAVASTSRDGVNLEESFRDAFKALCTSAQPGGTGGSVLHVLGGRDAPVGVLGAISGLADGVLDGRGSVGLASGEGRSRVVMVTELQGATRFDSYDPLDAIPRSDTIDWDEPECSIDCELKLPHLE